ncbi:MAG: folate-binding protein [Terricaulis sp.]
MPSPIRLDRALIGVSGPEARPFLQNLLTQDLHRLDAEPCVYAALLTPQGKVSADMIVWAREDGALIECAASRGADLLRKLTMYRLRAQVEVTDLSGAFGVDFFLGDAPPNAAPDPRLSALGRRAIVARGDGAPNEDALLSRRIALGVPDLAIDAGMDEVFALEALLEELNGVAFQKGCFVGQENVSRMKRRATTRKKFCPITFDGPAPAYGAAVRAGEAELGSVRSGVDGRAIAFLRLDRALEAKEPFMCDGRVVMLDPPDWLLLPSGEP